MQQASDAANQWLERLQREWEAQASALGITVDEFLARRDAEARAKREELTAKYVAQARALAVSRACAPGWRLPDTELGSEAVRHVKAWYSGADGLLVLCGGVGTGKSTAAALLVRDVELTRLEAWARKVHEVMNYTPPSPITEVVSASMLGRRADPWKQDLAAKIEPLNFRASLLILDDLGTERPDDARFAEAFFRVVDERQDPSTRTLITTNLKRADIRPRYGDRIADRLNHIGRAVEIKGASMRRKGEL